MKIQPPVGKVEKHIGAFQKHTVVFSAIVKKWFKIFQFMCIVADTQITFAAASVFEKLSVGYRLAQKHLHAVCKAQRLDGLLEFSLGILLQAYSCYRSGQMDKEVIFCFSRETT